MSRAAWLLGLALLRSGVGEDRSQFRYERAIRTQGAGESCAVLEPLIFAHAAESMRDLRLLRPDGSTVPYVVTMSGTEGADAVVVPVQNLTAHGALLAFDLVMPQRPYSQVVLDIASTNFVAVATVHGGEGTTSKSLGQFPIFDLSQEHLPRSTTLALAESTLPRLHVELRAARGSRALLPAVVRGATVPPSREAQTMYTNALVSSELEPRLQATAVRFTVPARVPIERVLFTLPASYHSDFSRAVRVDARTDTAGVGDTETVTGVITRLHAERDGVLLTADRLSVPATLGANLQAAASVQVTVEDGRNAPLPIRSVALQSRERRICFVASAAEPLTLFYGNAQLPAPAEQASGLTGSASARVATLGVEQLNPDYVRRVPSRSLLRRHPRLLSFGLLILVCLGGVIALRSTKLRV